jgi:hypothetical protein
MLVVDIARNVSAFRAFRTQVRGAFLEYDSPFVSIDVLLSWGTTRFAAVSVKHDPRRKGKSNYDVSKLIIHAVNMITGFSALPLRIANYLGFGFTLFGIGTLVYVMGNFVIRGGSVPGFSFLASMLAIFSGVQLFTLGIIGEYLARMHYRIMDRPSFTVRKKTLRE